LIKIVQVRSNVEAKAVHDLAHEFVAWLRTRYPEMNAEIDVYLETQKFEDQIKQVLLHFNPPHGECLLALHDKSPVGILMLKDLGQQVCEMNRMFVQEQARGLGAGRALVKRLFECAIEMGFKTMTLSALPRHDEAISLYRSIGFQDDVLAGKAGNSANAVLMRMDLTKI